MAEILTNAREGRLAKGLDEFVERHGVVVLVRCVSGMHAGNYIVWRGTRLEGIGSEVWARKKLTEAIEKAEE